VLFAVDVTFMQKSSIHMGIGKSFRAPALRANYMPNKLM